jgi:hypothetical protein
MLGRTTYKRAVASLNPGIPAGDTQTLEILRVHRLGSSEPKNPAEALVQGVRAPRAEIRVKVNS